MEISLKNFKNLKNIILSPMNLLYKVNPEFELRLMFFLKQGYKLNLKNPKTFNEKLNWIKLNFKNDLMPICADKYTVRKYVEEKGCKKILNELLWEGYDAKDIPFNDLPTQFVIKVTHGSGYNIICKNKKDLDFDKTTKQLNNWLKQKFLPCYGEWFYGVIKPRIIIEKFLSSDGFDEPVDYKLYYFNDLFNSGLPGVGLTTYDDQRFVNHKRTVYDYQWNFAEVETFDFKNDKSVFHSKPALYEEMVKYAKILAEPFPHARIDFYIVDSKIYFGEITFMNSAGFGKILPYSYSKKMGDWIKIPDRQGA